MAGGWSIISQGRKSNTVNTQNSVDLQEELWMLNDTEYCQVSLCVDF